jgi:hypothetical protein
MLEAVKWDAEDVITRDLRSWNVLALKVNSSDVRLSACNTSRMIRRIFGDDDALTHDTQRMRDNVASPEGRIWYGRYAIRG